MSNTALTKKLPHKPGCYIFKENSGKILYIGKAKNLKKRVSSYFSSRPDERIAELVKLIKKVDFIVTRDEVEALIVEAKLIKLHQPKFNIDLKTGDRYAYIRITDEEFPRLETARQIKKGEKVFGPYTNGEVRKESIRLANNLFQLRVCKNKKGRRCLLSHIGVCACPYATGMSKSEYSQRLQKAILFLKGETKELLSKLEHEMKEYSKKQKFEKAKVRRDQILAIHNISDNKPKKLQRRFNQDVIHYVATQRRLEIQMFNINKGVISGKKAFKIKRHPSTRSARSGRGNQNSKSILTAFVKQYYYSKDIPQEVIVPEILDEQDVVQKYLTKHSKHSVKITVPKKGEKKKLLDLLLENIKVRLASGTSALLELQEVLKLPMIPLRIECFDISNLGSKFKVGSMVHFYDGRPDKSNYRRFKIKIVEGQSDFDSMKEIVARRYYRLKKENAQFPQLIVIDGGKPQLTAAVMSLRELGLHVPIIALAKKFEEIYTTNQTHPIRLSKKSGALKVLQQARNEAHRFAIIYHRLLRSKKFTK